MGADAVRLLGVSKAYGGRPVLERLELRLPSTGMTFVVGKSGSGKSVLCRLAVGLERADEGEVFLFGHPLKGRSERALLPLRRLAPYLVQGPALLDWLSLRQNVELADRRATLGAVEAALARVGLLELADLTPPQVGPGVRKRAAIARALLLDPGYLLFDEPTTGLDQEAAGQVSQVLVKLRDEGLGAMVVSHDYPLLARIADRVVLVEGGKAQLFETRESFVESRQPQVRALLGPVEAELAGDG